MRVLLVHDYASLAGGAEVGMFGLRDALRARGHDARFLASSAQATGARACADYECFGTASRFRTLVQTANPLAARELRRVVGEFRPDVVHVGMFLTQLSPLILGTLERVPSVYHVRWVRPVCPTGSKVLPDGSLCHHPVGGACYRFGCLPLRDWAPLMLQMALWRRWSDAFDAIVPISEAMRQQLLEAGFDPVDVIYNGVPVRPERPPLAPPPSVGFAARLVPGKGAFVLLDAFARVLEQLPEARLLIAGDGPERANLEAKARRLGIGSSVDMLGYLPQDDLERALARVWVQAVPSTVLEAFGMAAAEGAMRGTAIVASDIGGLSEVVVDGETGRLVPPRDALALGEALIELLGDVEAAERLGSRGREFARARFGEEQCIDRFVALYERLVTSGRDHART